MTLPPFARLAEKYSVSTELRIYAGSNPQAWDVARLRNSGGPAVLLPAGDDFNDYKWPVSGREVLMLLLGPFDQVQNFAAHLLAQGALVVRVLRGEKLDTYRRGDTKN
jgi:hypothetical protein